MMKKNSHKLTVSIGRLLIKSLSIYFLFFSIFFSAHVGSATICISDDTIVSGLQNINVSSSGEFDAAKGITIVGEAKIIEYSEEAEKQAANLQKENNSKKESLNIPKKAIKIAKKKDVERKINTANINTAEQTTFFHSGGLLGSVAASIVSQWSAKGVLNTSLMSFHSGKYQDLIFIIFHNLCLTAEVGRASAFIRPPPALV